MDELLEAELYPENSLCEEHKVILYALLEVIEGFLHVALLVSIRAATSLAENSMLQFGGLIFSHLLTAAPMCNRLILQSLHKIPALLKERHVHGCC